MSLDGATADSLLRELRLPGVLNETKEARFFEALGSDPVNQYLAHDDIIVTALSICDARRSGRSMDEEFAVFERFARDYGLPDPASSFAAIVSAIDAAQSCEGIIFS